MHFPCLFVVVPVAIIIAASAVGSSASPTKLIHKKHHTATHHRARTPHAANSTRRTRVKHVMLPRSVDVFDLFLGELTSDHSGILSASDAFCAILFLLRRALLTAYTTLPPPPPAHTAKNARSDSVHDSAYQREAATGLTTYRQSLDPLQSLLVRLATDNGLTHYDKSNKYETLLKDIVDASKYTLSDVDDIINADPLLGPILGPIVYDIKCILDEILDATENITDASLNWLAPLLKSLIESATKTVCNSLIVPPVAELCLTL